MCWAPTRPLLITNKTLSFSNTTRYRQKKHHCYICSAVCQNIRGIGYNNTSFFCCLCINIIKANAEICHNLTVTIFHIKNFRINLKIRNRRAQSISITHCFFQFFNRHFVIVFIYYSIKKFFCFCFCRFRPFSSKDNFWFTHFVLSPTS